MGRVLCLNKSFTPVKIVSRNSAIVKFYGDTCKGITLHNGVMEEFSWYEWLDRSLSNDWPEDQEFIMSCSQRIAVPSVIRYLKYDKIPKRTHHPTRRSIYERDGHRCYICGKEFKESQLSLDHVVPLSRGGRGTWTNLVTCCMKCNFEKDDKLLSELKIKPKFTPYEPKVSNMALLKMDARRGYREEWSYFGV